MAGIVPYTDERWRKTNADRIRAMSDEELAKWIEQLESDKCPCDDWFERCEKRTCKGCWLNWLKEETKGDT